MRRYGWATARVHRRPRAVGALALLAGALALLPIMIFAASKAADRAFESAPPPVGAIDVYALYHDDTPVSLTTTALWQKIPTTATRDAVRSDVTLWRRMRLEDWDTVPMPLRHQGLDAMFDRYGDLVANPRRWDRMTAYDWDGVPHPVRVVAYRHMADYWSGYYHLGAAYRIPPRIMSDTLATLLMSESWFEHRAVNVNTSGNRDLGLAQASDCTRARMVALSEAGTVDAHFDEPDYFNPWKATRFAAIWLGLLLNEAGGVSDVAIRAYHTGGARALRGDGADYLALVKYRMHRYITNHTAPDAWNHVWQLDRTLAARSRSLAGITTAGSGPSSTLHHSPGGTPEGKEMPWIERGGQ